MNLPHIFLNYNSNVVDMFPYTDSVKNTMNVFPFTDGSNDIHSVISTHVEMVVLMSRVKE